MTRSSPCTFCGYALKNPIGGKLDCGVQEFKVRLSQASLNVARRPVRATITTIKNFSRPQLGSGPFLRSPFMVHKISEFLALIIAYDTVH